MNLIGRVVLALALAAAPEALAECHWWQFGHCSDSTAGLPDEAPRTGVVITIDVSTNRAYLFRDGELVAKSAAATGSGKEFVYGNDMWVFHTPRGHHKVLGKIKDPIWRKPDWAFIEAGEPIPPRRILLEPKLVVRQSTERHADKSPRAAIA